MLACQWLSTGVPICCDSVSGFNPLSPAGQRAPVRPAPRLDPRKRTSCTEDRASRGSHAYAPRPGPIVPLNRAARFGGPPISADLAPRSSVLTTWQARGARFGHYVLVQNPGGVPRRMRTGLAVVPLLAIAVVLFAMAALNTANHDTVRPADTPVETSDDAAASPGAPPYFRAAPGWETSQGGVVATAGNVPLGPDALEGNFPAYGTIGRLEEGEVLLQAAVYPMGESMAVDTIFRPRQLPLSSDEAYPMLSFEGQPDHIYAERLGVQVNGWNIDLLIFYGGGDPTAVPPVRSEPTVETRTAAQEQLERLVVPAHV
jgi:hypothetical protein